MKFLLKPTDLSKLETDVLIMFCYEKEISELSGFNNEFIKLVKEAAAREEFEGKEEQILILSTRGVISSYKFILVGLGDKVNFKIDKLYKSVAMAVKKAREARPVKIALKPDEMWLKKFQADTVVRILVEAISLALYKFDKYKGEVEKKKIRPIEEIVISTSPGRITASEKGISDGISISDAVIFARDLVNEPSEVTSPAYLAETALRIAESSKGYIKANIFNHEDIAKLKMGAFLGVAQGSDKPPKFIRLSYRPVNPKKKVVIIGKGITFDTGGLSLKGAEHMETMKLDMSGAAAVLAVFKTLASLGSKTEVVGLIAACENMPSGKALKPGDILTVMNGKTIEVLNTDAEGRLTLADAISYAVIKEKPDEIIDLATLTGACMVALGQEIAGLWGNNDKLISRIEISAGITGEKIWEMPLSLEYKELIKSHIADIKNTQTGRFGGAITAALFLEEFVDSIPWVHLDIAGPSYAEKDTPLAPLGGTGFGVRLLLHYLATD